MEEQLRTAGLSGSSGPDDLQAQFGNCQHSSERQVERRGLKEDMCTE